MNKSLNIFYPHLPVLLAVSAILVCGSCAGTPANTQAPAWVESVESVFPADAYIAVRGTSRSRENLEQDALRSLSLYFETQVSSRSELAESYVEQDGAATQRVSLDQQTLVQTETRLFAVRYAEPWLNPATKTWETAAYIDRAEAWAIFEPRLASQTAPFMALYQAAEADAEPMRRYLCYRGAAARADLSAYLDFAQTLNPARAGAFSPVRDALGALAQRLNQARLEASVYIDCPVDLNGAIRAALTKALSAEGFPVTGDRDAAGAVCSATVNEGAERREVGTFYNPELVLIISDKTGNALASMTLKGPRQSAIGPDIARRRGYTALAAEVEAAFHDEFERQTT
ncbi:MAG: hypothetical protein LBH75_07125, partial [Treponema sp.]|nr:hypothetical protein [Treponema sp.]